jgi:uncharacterized SAM-binding protein YcdF (DUF218 family)
LTRRIPRKPVSRKRARRKSLGWKPRLAIATLIVVMVVLVLAIVVRQLSPTSNTSLTRFDAIIVLGTPADSDGNPKPFMLSRVTEAVREYKKGVAPRLILTGGPTHNGFVEARVMARTAQAQGIPESAIFMEPQAMDTMQNACYAVRIMKSHGWRSAEVVAGAHQLPRAGLIFNSIASPSLEWSAHTAPPLSPQSAAYENALAAVEVLKTARYLIWARWAERCEP